MGKIRHFGELLVIGVTLPRPAPSGSIAYSLRLWLSVQTTTLETGQQWDGSNCWPPLLQMAIEAVINTGDCASIEDLKHMADRHIFSCINVGPNVLCTGHIIR